MIIKSPFIIGPRLLVALKIGDVMVSYDTSTNDFHIDGKGWSESVTDYTPGPSVHDYREAFADILLFMLGAPEDFGEQTQMWIEENEIRIQSAFEEVDYDCRGGG